MEREFLWAQLLDLPYFRAALRAVEARWMHDVELQEPVLDIGSGDGHFASAVFSRKLDVGIDPDRMVMASAKRYEGYRNLLQAEGARLPFANDSFSSAVSNSVLEHIPDLDPVLQDINRVLRPGAVFAFTVPNPGYRSELAVPQLLKRLGGTKLARNYTEWFMRVTRTLNLLDQSGWEQKLQQTGFKVEKAFNYFSPRSLAVLEWGHYLGVPCVIAKALSGRWILVRKHWNLAFTYSMVQRFYEEQPADCGTYSFYLTRKLG